MPPSNLEERSEPLGGLLALFGALFEDEVRAVYVAGGLDSYHRVLSCRLTVVCARQSATPNSFSRL